KHLEIEIDIIVYSIMDNALENFKKFLSDNNIAKYKIKYNSITKRYDQKLEYNSIQYVNDMKTNLKDKQKYGYKNTGSLIAIDGISPNNNLAIIYHDQLEVNNKKWYPLLNRDYRVHIFDMFKLDVFKNCNQAFYDVISINGNLFKSMKELQLFYFLYNFNYATEDMIESFFGIDSMEEVEQIIKKSIENNIIGFDKVKWLILDNDILVVMEKINLFILKELYSIAREKKQI